MSTQNYIVIRSPNPKKANANLILWPTEMMKQNDGERSRKLPSDEPKNQNT